MRLPTKYGFSLEVNPASYFAQCLKEHQSYEEADSDLVLSLVDRDDFCIDAGAYVGYYSVLMASRGAQVIAIEPNPRNYNYLVQNSEGGNILTCSMALSDRDEEQVDFFLPSEFDDGWGSLAAADSGDRSRSIQVSTCRMDSLLSLFDLVPKRIRLVKMDIEGAEVPALRGFGNRLEDVDHFLIECVDIPSRVEVFGSTVEGIDQIFAGWKVEVAGRVVPNAISNGENFLFTNPKASR